MGGEANQALFVNKYRQWLYILDQDVDPQITLVPTNQQRVRNVSLYDAWVVEVVKLADVVDKEDVAATGHVRRLADPEVLHQDLECLGLLLDVHVFGPGA